MIQLTAHVCERVSQILISKQSLFCSKFCGKNTKKNAKNAAQVSGRCECSMRSRRKHEGLKVSEKTPALLVASGFTAQPSHVMLPVTLAPSVVLRSSSRVFKQKRDCSHLISLLPKRDPTLSLSEVLVFCPWIRRCLASLGRIWDRSIQLEGVSNTAKHLCPALSGAITEAMRDK